MIIRPRQPIEMESTNRDIPAILQIYDEGYEERVKALERIFHNKYTNEAVNMKRKIFFGTIFGVVAGIIDVIPMMIQNLPIYSILSAFSMWVVLGFIINTSALKINGILKGLLLSFLVILPTAILIAQTEPISLIPISIMTVVLGALLGFISDKFVK